MSNTIMIQYKNPFNEDYKINLDPASVTKDRDTRIFYLEQDIVLDIQSQMTAIKDLVPNIVGTAVDMMSKFQSATGSANMGLNTFMDIPLWDRTDPLKITTQLLFYTKNDAKKDVWEGAMGLASNAMLSIAADGKTFKTPGMNLSSYGEWKGADKEVSSKSIGKLVKVEIPGILYLEHAIVLSAKPTFSKEVTESGYPLWATVDIDIRSVYPANDLMFKNLTVNRKTDGGIF